MSGWWLVLAHFQAWVRNPWGAKERREKYWPAPGSHTYLASAAPAPIESPNWGSRLPARRYSQRCYKSSAKRKAVQVGKFWGQCFPPLRESRVPQYRRWDSLCRWGRLSTATSRVLWYRHWSCGLRWSPGCVRGGFDSRCSSFQFDTCRLLRRHAGWWKIEHVEPGGLLEGWRGLISSRVLLFASKAISCTALILNDLNYKL